MSRAQIIPPLNRASSEACIRLSHYPSGSVEAPLGAFDNSRPLTAKTGPGAVIFRLIRGHMPPLPWANLSDFLDDLIGGVCVCFLPFVLLFLEFVK
ncbi:hypothetical protein [Pseudophaeobacter sp.]|uniref:hypothetical protein n=1 Tax=Pseudophaeobacter sp. TaxID=1971739 RepID=UPI0032991531